MDLNADRPLSVSPRDRGSLAPIWRIAVGLLVIGYGLVLLADNLGFNVRVFERAFLPAGIFVVSVVMAVRSGTTTGRTVGGIVALAAAAWAYAEFAGRTIDASFWWPVVLIVIGVVFLLRSREGVTERNTVTPGGPSQASAVAFWSGVRRRITSAAFSRADFVAVMGGIEADFRPAATAGGTAVIEVFVLMGGIEITVPPDWAVVNRATVIMGGVNDRSTGSQGAVNTLYIQGVVMMGGVEIKS
jgi:hypothetical protein